MWSIAALNRYSACGVHLVGSVCVVGLAAALVYICWYPGLLSYADGVTNIFIMLVCIDIVLGPLITLIVFDLRKKELRRDLSIVICIQIAALLYGMFILFYSRPAFVVFNADRFDVVYANEIQNMAIPTVSPSSFKSPFLFGPKFVGARLPEDASKAKEIILSAINGGNDIQQMPEFYIPIDNMKDDIKRAARPLDELKEYNKQSLDEVASLINRFDIKNDQIGYVPLVAKKHSIVVVVNKDNSAIIALSKLAPLDNSFGVNSIDLKSILKNK